MATRSPAATTTQFRIGSVSKLLTATLLMRLAQTGQLDLDAPVSRYVNVPAPLADVTLRQLAGHLGGVRHYRGNEFLSNTHYDSLSAALSVFLNDSLLARPGSRYLYSSYGYNLLGVAIERATGLPFTRAMRRHVLEPLSLGGTTEDDKGATLRHRAALYMVSGDRMATAPDDDLSGRWPSGGYLSTTDDLALFGRTVLARFAQRRVDTNDAYTAADDGWRTDGSRHRLAYRTGLDSRRLLSPRRNVEQWQCVRVGPSVASAGDRHGDQRLGAVQRARRHRADRADSSLSLAAWSPRCSRSSDCSIAARSSIARRSPRSSGSMAASSLS